MVRWCPGKLTIIYTVHLSLKVYQTQKHPPTYFEPLRLLITRHIFLRSGVSCNRFGKSELGLFEIPTPPTKSDAGDFFERHVRRHEQRDPGVPHVHGKRRIFPLRPGGIRTTVRARPFREVRKR